MSVHTPPAAFEAAVPVDRSRPAEAPPPDRDRVLGVWLTAGGLALIGGFLGLVFGAVAGVLSGLIELC